jgi:hypothetical protein
VWLPLAILAKSTRNLPEIHPIVNLAKVVGNYLAAICPGAPCHVDCCSGLAAFSFLERTGA